VQPLCGIYIHLSTFLSQQAPIVWGSPRCLLRPRYWLPSGTPYHPWSFSRGHVDWSNPLRGRGSYTPNSKFFFFAIFFFNPGRQLFLHFIFGLVFKRAVANFEAFRCGRDSCFDSESLEDLERKLHVQAQSAEHVFYHYHSNIQAEVEQRGRRMSSLTNLTSTFFPKVDSPVATLNRVFWAVQITDVKHHFRVFIYKVHACMETSNKLGPTIPHHCSYPQTVYFFAMDLSSLTPLLL
jgi:hypothetical protein